MKDRSLKISDIVLPFDFDLTTKNFAAQAYWSLL